MAIKLRGLNWKTLATAGLIAAVTSGCAPTFSIFGSDKPSTDPSPWTGPTVKILVNHVTCELENAYKMGSADTYPAASLWKELAENNFVAAVDLNLALTHMEGLNPGYSAIIPLNAIGHGVPLSTTTGTPPVTTFAQATYNRTLAVSGQLNGTQDNAIDLD